MVKTAQKGVINGQSTLTKKPPITAGHRADNSLWLVRVYGIDTACMLLTLILTLIVLRSERSSVDTRPLIRIT